MGVILRTGRTQFLLCGGGKGRESFLIEPRLSIVAGPCLTEDGAVTLVAPGAKGFFEPGLGGRGKLRVLLGVGLRGRPPRGLS